MPKKVLSARVVKHAGAFVDWLVLNGIDRGDAAEKVRLFAEAIAGKVPRAKTSNTANAGPAMELYVALFRERHREDPVVSPVDAVLLTNLVKKVGVDLVCRRLRVFAAWDDPFVRKLGFTIQVFARRWNQLAGLDHASDSSQRARPAPADCRHSPRCSTDQMHSDRQFEDRRKS